MFHSCVLSLHGIEVLPGTHYTAVRESFHRRDIVSISQIRTISIIAFGVTSRLLTGTHWQTLSIVRIAHLTHANSL